MLLEQVYLLQEKGEDTDWLREYYAGQGIQIEIELTDILRDAMCVYKIRAAG